MSSITFQWQVPNHYHQQLLRSFLRDEKEISRQALTDIKKAGAILINGEKVTVRAVLNEGDDVTVVFPDEERSSGLQAKGDIPLSIIYEDEHLMVINKQPNLPTIPSKYHPDRSLANGVLYYYDKNNIQCTFHAVNRLDRDTSGLLIVAKHRYSHDLLTRQQRNGTVHRTYLALVHGQLCKEKGTLIEPIGRKEGSIIEREVRSDGQVAVTNYQVVKVLNGASLVQLSLETGRTHQIRVHMAYNGHPLLGDDLYGGLLTKIERQALHSWKLEFYHPFYQKNLSFTVEPPEDMLKIINEQ